MNGRDKGTGHKRRWEFSRQDWRKMGMWPPSPHSCARHRYHDHESTARGERGEFRTLRWIKRQITAAVLDYFEKNPQPKIPFTDEGIETITNRIKGVLEQFDTPNHIEIRGTITP